MKYLSQPIYIYSNATIFRGDSYPFPQLMPCLLDEHPELPVIFHLNTRVPG